MMKQLSLENSQISIFFTRYDYSKDGLLRLWNGNECVAVLNGSIYLHHTVGDYAEVYCLEKENL